MNIYNVLKDVPIGQLSFGLPATNLAAQELLDNQSLPLSDL